MAEGTTSKAKNEYDTWSLAESALLVELLVDAHHHGWRNSSGKFEKKFVESKILAKINEQLNVQRNYSHYLSRMKTLKRKYQKFQALKAHSSGFGFDPNTKRFTATEEVWNGFIESHPNSSFLRNESFPEFEELDIIIGGGTCAIGGVTIGSLDVDDDVSHESPVTATFGGINTLVYDESTSAFTLAPEDSPDVFAHPFHASAPNDSPIHNEEATENVRVGPPPPHMSRQKKKRCTSESSSNHPEWDDNMASIRKLLEDDKMADDIWPFIEEVPGLDDETRFMALDILSTRPLRIAFIRLTPERRKAWLMFKLHQSG